MVQNENRPGSHDHGRRRMKHGLLVFSYSNFDHFRTEHAAFGEYSINLGDYMQTIAVRDLYESWGIDPADIIRIDRDTLPLYAGEPTSLVMNGCFYSWCFPIPDHVRPIFVGFQADESVITANRFYLKRHEPIGCRDSVTAALCRQYGINSFVTGCLTMTFPERTPLPYSGKTFLSYGLYGGTFPAKIIQSMPDEILGSHLLEFISQRKTVRRFPLDQREMETAETDAHFLLRKYRREAGLVVTPLHHAATPCLSSGIPIILCRFTDDGRFSLLRDLIPIYFPQDFDRIDWKPLPADISAFRSQLIETAHHFMQLARTR